MIRCALAETLRLAVEMPCASRAASSTSSTPGSTTTPSPISVVMCGWRMPLGTRWSRKVRPPTTTVWPALLPPWERTTTSILSASRSVALPLPSSPHWAPTRIVPGILHSLSPWASDGPSLEVIHPGGSPKTAPSRSPPSGPAAGSLPGPQVAVAGPRCQGKARPPGDQTLVGGSQPDAGKNGWGADEQPDGGNLAEQEPGEQ